MKKLGFIILLFCAFNIKAQNNLVRNGSFELNNVIGQSDCKTELSNTDYSSLMYHSSSFSQYGLNENSIFFENCLTYAPTVVPNGIAYDGNYSLVLNCWDTIFYPGNPPVEKYTALSLSLFPNLQVGTFYRLSFYQKIFPNGLGVFNNLLAGQIVVGISDSATTFGTTIDTMAYPTSEWNKVEVIFQATTSASYLTIKAALEQGYHGALVDHFVLEVDSVPPNAIYEHQDKKQLLKIVDVLGRESKPKANTPFFYLYDDGTVEKSVIIE